MRNKHKLPYKFERPLKAIKNHEACIGDTISLYVDDIC